MLRCGVELGGSFELLLLAVAALLLHLAQLGGVLFALAAEAAELKLQVSQLLFVREESVDFDEAGSQSGRFRGQPALQVRLAEPLVRDAVHR